MISAFGVDHGEISKASLGEFARGFAGGVKLARKNIKDVRAEAGLPGTAAVNMMHAVKAGKYGNASQYRKANKLARQAAKERTMRQLKGGPEPMFKPETGKIIRAGSAHHMSQRDWRLHL